MSKPVLHMPADFMQRPPMLRLYDGPCRGDAVTMFHDLAGSCALGRQDGIVLRGATIRLGLHACAASELVRVGLWAQNDEGDYVIVDWLEIFPPARIKARREADAVRKARERTTARELKALAAKGAKGLEHAARSCVQPSPVSSRDPMAILTESRCDSVTFAAASRDSVINEPVTETRQHRLQPRTASAAAARDLSALSDVSWTQPKDTVTPAVQLSDEELFGISDEVGTSFALKDLNLKKEKNSSSTPPPSAIRSIENVARETAERRAAKAARRPAARRTSTEPGLWLPFDAAPSRQAADTLAARGAALIFEATTMTHPPFSPKNREYCEWLADRPASEWAIAKPVLLAEANKRGVKQMLTPKHIADCWATHYSLGFAPVGREALDRERAKLKPMRSGFVGPSELPTEAQYAAERAAAAAGTWGARC